MSETTETQQEKPAPAPAAAVAPQRKTIYLNRLSLYGQATDGGQAPRLYWGIFDGNPRIIVRTNVKEDAEKNFGQIIAPIDAFTAGVIAGILQECASAEPGWRQKISNKSTWLNGQSFDTPTHINDIIIGKDSEGVMYISVHEDNRPNIRFFFGPSQWHTLVKADGTPVSKAELSCIYAKGYANVVLGCISTIIGYGSYVSTFTDFDGHNNQAEKPTFTRGDNQGGNRQFNNNGGGYQKKQWNGGQGGGGYNRGGGQGGWQNRNNGGQQGGWQNRNNGGGGGGYNRNNGGGGYQNQQQSTNNIPNEDIPL